LLTKRIIHAYDSAYTVVHFIGDAPSQCMEGHFPGARNPGTYSDEVWHVQLRPPSCQIRGGRHKWTGVDIWVNLYPGVLFYFSDSSITRTAKSEKRGFSLNAPKIYLAVGALLWVLFASGSNLQHFTSKNIFFRWTHRGYYFARELIGNAPYC